MSDVWNRLARRVLLMVGRGRIGPVDDSGAVQLVQVALGPLETRDKLPRVAEFGFSSNPPEGSHAVVVFVSGDRSNGVVVGTNHQDSRVKNLQPGEAVLFDNAGRSIWLKAAGIVIETNGGTLTVNGNLTVHGSVTADDEGTFNGVHTVSAHTHGGVTAGGATTAPPTG